MGPYDIFSWLQSSSYEYARETMLHHLSECLLEAEYGALTQEKPC